MELASGYYSRGQYETALDEVKLALAVKPDLPDAYNLRGLIYQSLGEDKLAEENFKRALQLNPRDPDIMHNYGWFLCQNRRIPEALAQFQQAIAHEVVPAIHVDSAGPQEVIVAGASIGAFNSLALISRWPHLFRSAICMSGTFDIEQLIGGFTTDLFYSSPLHFLPGMEGPDLDRLRERFVYLPSGSGAWEDVGESWRAAEVLGTKCVPNRVDDWGPDFDHDWPTWWQMLPNYVQQAL